MLLTVAVIAAPAAFAQTPGDDEDASASEQRRNERVRGEADAPAASAEAASAPERTETATTRLDAVKDGAYALELRGPRRVRELLARHLDLARFRTQTDIAPVELGRLMAATPAEVRALLEPEGWFEARVDVQRVPAPEGGGVPTIRVEVDPGPPVLVGRLDFQLRGPWSAALDDNDPESERLARRWARLQRGWALPSGRVFTQSGWSDAKNALLIASRSRGYANARYADTLADIDVPKRRADLSVALDSGPLYRLGEVRVEGLQRTPASAALNLRPFELGSVYTEGALLDYQEALQKVGLYEGIAVELDLDAPDPANAVVIARLREAQAQNASFSVGFSSNTGPRFGVEHTHRRFFGRDLVASSKLRFGRDERTASFDLLTYPKEGGVRDLAGVSYEYLDAGGALTVTQRARIGRQRETQRIDRLVTFEYLQTRLETATRSGTDRALWGNVAWSHRDVNNLSFPTRGLIVGAQAGGGAARDADGEQGPFARLQLGATWYRPLVAGWLGQFRGEVAQVVKKETQGVPDALLFRAGGDDSVRGYGYRTLGPVRDGAVVGGPVLATASVEAMHRFTDARGSRWRDWYYAAFVDAGNAADDWNELDPALGYGVGVRWRSPIGPLRVDLAYGERVRSVRLHISVGVSFR
ncbi:MAG TPA: BamA/TamA family outer membrane protein [Methylibium sp.]|uniref:autotransporter assembly complex protein TamA n=1 Tax=Methylibium sp. TaxID=2067992 RepID=UPI002DB7B3B1|nr:BamA/TamA family outer membrane protein [Methylibium sp.]HEU4458185.1 BamA/TamA family outer membrane protein [Methylibium sp.]